MSSGVGFSELLILFVIGLIILGPERLPRVANEIGTWVGKARRMTRVMKRQLEEELDMDKHLGLEATLHPPPRDDDDYSPLHDNEGPTIGSVSDAAAAAAEDATENKEPESERRDG